MILFAAIVYNQWLIIVSPCKELEEGCLATNIAIIIFIVHWQNQLKLSSIDQVVTEEAIN